MEEPGQTAPLPPQPEAGVEPQPETGPADISAEERQGLGRESAKEKAPSPTMQAPQPLQMELGTSKEPAPGTSQGTTQKVAGEVVVEGLKGILKGAGTSLGKSISEGTCCPDDSEGS
uniref:Uncharacterized protein n=1 Tax=Ombrophytum subterraneum TaxID=50155 RepID=A0A6M8PXR0_9MAGN|nr:hypothetical protein [Ombrophytum subterraneum]